MAKSCAVFWDIQNIDVPKGQSGDTIVNLIRSTIIKPHNLKEIFFYCVCDVNKLARNIGQSLTTLDVEIVQAYNNVKDSADMKILDLMRHFVKLVGQGCTIVLISGDTDYYGTLNDLKKLYNVSIHLIRLANSFSSKLDEISDYTFILNNGTLTPVKSTGSPMYFISIKHYPLTMNITHVMAALNSQIAESIQKSSILFDGSIYIGFPTLWNAERAVKKFNGSRFHGYFLKVELIVDSPLSDILKCIMPGVTVPSKSTKEVKKLTFIKINNSNRTVNNSKIIEFCNTQSGHQCILSRNSFLWIVFNFKSAAKNCLSELKIKYPDAIISEPPNDLTLSCLKNQYTVDSCKQKVTKETRTEVDINLTEPKSEINIQVNLQKTNFSSESLREIHPSCDTKSVKKTTNSGSLAASNSHSSVNNDWKLCFRYNHFADTKLPDLTKWSLLYHAFEQIYDLGAKKVIFDGDIYCVSFYSFSAYQGALEKMHSRYFKSLQLITEISAEQITQEMNAYTKQIPWCLNEKLGLHCFEVKIKSVFHKELIENIKVVLGSRECIFLKSNPGKILIGYPNELICKASEQKLYTIVSCIMMAYRAKWNISLAKPSKELLESITFQDLVGDAYDLAFLSRQLMSLKATQRPRIIEQISLHRMQKIECNESIFYFIVKGQFGHKKHWEKLSLAQVIKILVKLSKVIPLAAIASEFAIVLVYNSWYEAHAAHHYINKNTCPGLAYLFIRKVEEIQENITFFSLSTYYIINNKRKILNKIVKNMSLTSRIKPNLLQIQSSSDIWDLDVKMIKKIQYYYVIKIDSGYKFASEMITIIKLHLLHINCPIFVEFENKIWVQIDDIQSGDKVKAHIEQMKFQILHENDEDDFEVVPEMKTTRSIPPVVAIKMANKLNNEAKTFVKSTNLTCNAVPLGHFNYDYRRAVGMSISQYCKIHELH